MDFLGPKTPHAKIAVPTLVLHNDGVLLIGGRPGYDPSFSSIYLLKCFETVGESCKWVEWQGLTLKVPRNAGIGVILPQVP